MTRNAKTLSLVPRLLNLMCLNINTLSFFHGLISTGLGHNSPGWILPDRVRPHVLHETPGTGVENGIAHFSIKTLWILPSDDLFFP